MPVLTSTVQPATKAFSWSYSRLHAFEDCARRYHETQVRKAWPEEKSEQLVWGDRVHAAMAIALKTNRKLEEEFADYQHWIDRVHRTDGDLRVEDDCKLAIDRTFKPVTWFSPKAWMRTVADVSKVDDRVALVVDWKTGKSSNVDVLQLTLASLMMFCHYPRLQRVRSDFVWLAEDACTSQRIDRHEAAEQWAEIMPRVGRLQQATIAEHFPPTPGKFCRSWCPVKSCEYHGK